MSLLRTLPIAALAAVAGFLLGRATTSRGPAEADPFSEPAQTGPAPTIQVPSAPSAARAAPTDDALRDALAGAAAPSLNVGDATIVGTVRTGDGEPLPGVRVTASLQRGGPPCPCLIKENPDPVQRLRACVDWVDWSRVTDRTATTDARGAYRLSGLAAGPQYVTAELEGWQLSDGARVSVPGRPGETVDFTAHPATTVRFDVRRADGSVPDSAKLEIEGPDGPDSEWWFSHQDPTPMRAGVHRFTAIEEDGILRSEQVEVLLETGKPATIRLDIQERPGIRVRLRWAEGEKPFNPSVRFVALAEGEQPDSAALERLSTRGERVVPERLLYLSDALGITDIEPGRYLVAVARHDHWPWSIAASGVVQVGAGVADLMLTVPPLDRSAYVLAKILDPDGRPVSRAYAYLTGVATELLRRPDGTLWVVPLAQGPPMSDARWRLEAWASPFGKRTVDVRLGSAPEAIVRFGPPAHVQVACGGVPRPRVRRRLSVALEPLDDGLGRASPVAPSADWVATLEPVQAGEYEVVVVVRPEESSTLATDGREILRVLVSVHSGPQRVSVTLPPLYAVNVQTAGVEGTVRIEGESLWRMSATSDREGRARFEGLPAGTYRLGVPLGEDRVFTVPGTTEVDAR
jgi:hypothetical protein